MKMPAGIDLNTVLSKLPLLVPLFQTRVKTEKCKTDLQAFSKNVLSDSGDAVVVLQREICALDYSCIEETVQAMKKMVQTGGFVEKMAKTFLEGKGVDLDTLDILILAYIQENCGEFKDASSELNQKQEL